MHKLGARAVKNDWRKNLHLYEDSMVIYVTDDLYSLVFLLNCDSCIISATINVVTIHFDIAIDKLLHFVHKTTIIIYNEEKS